MCQDCGCGDVNLVPLDVQQRILARNDDVAEHNRAHFREHGIFAVNLMGSPGSGKTAVLEATARVLKGDQLAAVAGDLATDNDAARLTKAGIRSRSITTGQACHLDAAMVGRALEQLDPPLRSVVMIENCVRKLAESREAREESRLAESRESRDESQREERR